jgi:hypothetical protein
MNYNKSKHIKSQPTLKKMLGFRPQNYKHFTLHVYVYLHTVQIVGQRVQGGTCDNFCTFIFAKS